MSPRKRKLRIAKNRSGQDWKTNNSNQSDSTENPTIESLMESTSYNPDPPVFDTDSSSENNNDSDGSDFDEEKEGVPDDEDDDSLPARSRSGNNVKASSPENRDDFLNARVRITSGKYNGLIGRIRRVVNTGWIYIEGEDDGVTRPVRWGYVQVLSEDEAESDGSNNDDNNVDMQDANNESKSDQGGQKTKSNPQSLIGATIRIADSVHDGLEAIITEKRSGVYLKVDTLPGRILLLQDVEVVKLANPDADTDDEKYLGATVVADGGAEGTVEKVILGEWYITDNPEVKKAFKRKEFEVLRYADEPMSDGSMKDDRGEKTPKRSLRPKRKTRVARHYDTDEDEEEYYSSESEEEAPKRRKQTPLKSEESAGSENQSEETPSSQQNENHPLLGLTIRMNSGKGAGHVGKITKICSRGWLEVDGLDGFKVHGHLMSIVDDGKLDKKAIKDYYSAGRSRTKMPNIIKLDDKVHGDEGGDTVVDWGEDENEGLEMQDEANNSDDNMLISRASRYRNTKNRTEKDENRFTDKISSTDFSGATIDQEDSTTPDGRMSEAESIVRWGRKPASSLAVPNMPKLKDLNPGRRHV